MRVAKAVAHDPAIDAWFDDRSDLGALARRWFEVMRGRGAEARELLHYNQPVACVGHVAFAYVNVFAAHVGVGFHRGAELPDPAGLLEGTGKLMRHVKLRPGVAIDEDALTALIDAAYEDTRRLVEAG